MTAPAPAPYPVAIIQPDWVLSQEDMGSKTKFWFRWGETDIEWLFKYPQRNTGQHWAEKITAEIASSLDILHAPVELASYEGALGSATASFAREGRELVHGNQILLGKMLGYDTARRFHQSDHTLDNIFAALERVFPSPNSLRIARDRLAEYLLLDAVIGNTDRHHENWGILLKRTSGSLNVMVAPSFDHASSLGRELCDAGTAKSKSAILREGRVGSYAEKATGAIYWESTDRRGLSPLNLIRRASEKYPEPFDRARQLLDKLTVEGLRGIVDRVPETWMSEISRSFVIELVCYNLEQLRLIP